MRDFDCAGIGPASGRQTREGAEKTLRSAGRSINLCPQGSNARAIASSRNLITLEPPPALSRDAPEQLR
jgi:hypothetical protein